MEGTSPEPLAPLSVPRTLLHLARRAPDAVALVDVEQRLNASELFARMNGCAARLVARGVAPGDRVAVHADKRIDAVCWLLGTLRLGAIAVPLNPIWRDRQVKAALSDAQVCCVLGPNDPAPSSADEPDLPPVPEVDDTPAALLYTSGSTGAPRGVLLSHANLAYGAASVASYLRLNVTDRVMAIPPLSFDYGLNQLTSTLRAGGRVVLAEYRLPATLLASIEREGITVLPGVPTLWDRLAGLEWPPGARHLRCITNTGGALAPRTVRALASCLPATEIHLMYGFTEAFRATSLPAHLALAHPDTVGRAVPYAEVRVVRPDGSTCADDESGELVQRGPLLARGYWRDEHASARRWRPLRSGSSAAITDDPDDRWAWSGDVVERDAQGLIRHVSRRDDMVKLQGNRTYPAEIERALRDNALVQSCCVSCVPHPRTGLAVVVDVVLERGDDAPVALDGALDFALVGSKAPNAPDAALAKLLAWSRRELPAHQVPAAMFAVPDLPLGATGKVDRVRVRAQRLHTFAEPSPNAGHTEQLPARQNGAP